MTTPNTFPQVTGGECFSVSNPAPGRVFTFPLGCGAVCITAEAALVPSGNAGGFTPQTANPSGTNFTLINSSGTAIGQAVNITSAGVFYGVVPMLAGSMCQLTIGANDYWSRISCGMPPQGPGQAAGA
jgi:hypothetical protein